MLKKSSTTLLLLCGLLAARAALAVAVPSTPAAPVYEAKPGATIPIRYNLAKSGKVSINIYDQKGFIVRELLHTAERPAGDNLEVWDGLGREKQPLPAGKYSWKLISTPGLKAEYLMKVGTSFPIKRDAQWWQQAPGDITGPGDVFADESGLYVSASSENIGPALIKQTLDGTKRIWERKLPSAYVITRGMARVGDVLWVFSTNNKYLLPIHANTGGDAGQKISTDWDNEAGHYMTLCDGLLAVCYPGKGAVRWYDPATGKVAVTTEIKSPSAVASDGKVLYISDGSAIWKASKDAAPTLFVEGLELASRLAVDPTNGDVLVYEGNEGGSGRNQIKRFSHEGNLLKTYGWAGGRKHGLYTKEEQESFSGVFGLCSTPDGGFAIAEAWMPPRRAAMYDKDGKLKGEWYGAQMWAPWIIPEPDNPGALWMASDWNGCMRLLIDTKTKTWKVHSTYHYGSIPMMPSVMGIGTGIQGATVRGGELYLYNRGVVLKTDRKRGTWKAAAMITGDLRHGLDVHFDIQPPVIQQAVKARKPPGYSLAALRWSDANDDGQIQSTEAHWLLFTGGYVFNTRGPIVGWWNDKNGDEAAQEEEISKEPPSLLPSDNFMDGQFNFYALSEGFATDAKNRSLKYLPAKGWTPSGAPQYSASPQSFPVTGIPDSVAAAMYQTFMTRNDKTGDFYIAANAPNGWGNSNASSMIKLGPDGSFKWSSGSVGTNPGQIRNFRGIFGVVKDCVAAPNTSYEWHEEGVRTTYVWDKDGLYVGGLLDNPLVNESIPAWRYALGAESIFGKVWEYPKTGEVLFFGHWTSEGRIYRITGWDNWERLSGVLSLDKPAELGGNGVLASFVKSDGTRVGQWTTQSVNFDADKELKSQTAKAVAQSGKYFVRFTGQIAAPADDEYTFSTRGAGEVRLLLDGRIVIDTSLKPELSSLAVNPVTMKAGQRHDIQLEYSPAGGQNGRIELLWNSQGQEPAPVPSSALYAMPREVWSAVPYGKGIGVRGQYWTNFERKGTPAIERVEHLDINFQRDNNQGGASTAQWSGFLEARRTGLHRLRVGGAGSHMDVLGRNDKFVHMEAGKRYPISLLFADENIHPTHLHARGVRLDWIEPGHRDYQIVPQSQLYPTLK